MGNHTKVWGLDVAVLSITSLCISLAKKALMTKPNCKGGCTMYSSCEGRENKSYIFKLAVLCCGMWGD